ncbi:MAG: SRPBCC family protein [Patescibacteria group bacterium]|uniref:SRPBCC family protein n=1 Tax=candidate division WWE3 bacterium TaxID=2053526 RepID=A0A955J3R2_UNCKA|nr:SRPBCC family protein [candidate division WWE3 bacterium]
MEKITVQTNINASVEQVWECYTNPSHIVNWNTALPTWHTPKAENDLQVGGRFMFRMEAKDGSEGFDFSGEYLEVIPNELLSYKMDDNRIAVVKFMAQDASTTVEVTFDTEDQNPVAMQRTGWQSILDNFARYVESSN